MTDNRPGLILQKQHWEQTLRQRPDMFGAEPSEAARKAVERFVPEGASRILELGAGQGRDTLFFARRGFKIYALDYAHSGLASIKDKREALDVPASVALFCHDVRDALPFRDDVFDGCYSHMLYCMALTTPKLEFLSSEVRRVLRPGGINIYTVRHTGDPDYGKGIHHGEDIYEVNGFAVHYFSRAKVVGLAENWEILTVDELEEGRLPRELFFVVLRKPK